MKTLRVGYLSASDSGVGLDFYEGINALRPEVLIRIPYLQLFQELGLKLARERICEMVAESRLDVIVYPRDYEFAFPPDFFHQLRQRCVMVSFVGDDEHYFDRAGRYYSQAFDLVLVANPLNVERYALYGIEATFFPSGYDPRPFLTATVIEAPAVVFVGATEGKVGRREYIQAIVDAGIDVGIYGPGSAGGPVDRQQMLSLFKSAKISLNFTGVAYQTFLDYDLSVNQRTRQIKGRCQEIALAGGFVLSEYAPGIDRLFDTKTEIATFRTRKELIEQIRALLEDEGRRQKMARQAHQRALLDYDSVKQWERIGARIEHIASTRSVDEIPPLKIDRIFWRAYAAFHLNEIMLALLKGRWRFAWREVAVVIAAGAPDFGLLLRYFRKAIYEHVGSPKIVLKIFQMLFRRNRDA